MAKALPLSEAQPASKPPVVERWMRAAAIDLGDVRVGLAVADELGILAHPRPFLEGSRPERVLKALAEIAATEQIGVFLVGLPLLLDGSEGPRARSARRFADALRTRTGVEVELVDERLSTQQAAARLREQGLNEKAARQRIDSAAAAVLLQSWLDSKRPNPWLHHSPAEADE